MSTLKMVRDFDPNKSDHIQWLKKMTLCSPEEYTQVLSGNPMNIDTHDMDVLNWAQIHLCLCGKYVKYLFMNEGPTNN